MTYAPTTEGLVEEKDQFYEALETTMGMTNQNGMVMYICDFTATTGTERHPNVGGPHGSGMANSNDNTQRFINFGAGANLRVWGSWFEPSKYTLRERIFAV